MPHKVIGYPVSTIRWSLDENNQCLKMPRNALHYAESKTQHPKTGCQTEKVKSLALDKTQNLSMYIQVMSLDDKLQKEHLKQTDRGIT